MLLGRKKECNNSNCRAQMTLDTIILREASPRQVSYAITYERESRSVMSTLCEPPKDYTAHGILQARRLEWVAFPFSRGSSKPRDSTQVSYMAGGFFYQLSHKGRPRMLEWVAYPFSRGSSWPRNQTGVSWIAGGFSTNWTMQEGPDITYVWSQKLQVSEYNRKAVDSSIWGIS